MHFNTSAPETYQDGFLWTMWNVCLSRFSHQKAEGSQACPSDWELPGVFAATWSPTSLPRYKRPLESARPLCPAPGDLGLGDLEASTQTPLRIESLSV